MSRWPNSIVNTCITPIITYASETWNMNKEEQKKTNKILDKIIRRILMPPESTPREALYIETGLLDVQAIADSKRLNMKARLNNNRSEMMDMVLKYPGCQWTKKTNETMTQYNITEQELNGPKRRTKANIERKILDEFKKRLINEAQTK